MYILVSHYSRVGPHNALIIRTHLNIQNELPMRNNLHLLKYWFILEFILKAKLPDYWLNIHRMLHVLTS